MQSSLDILKLWMHECQRVLADRFTQQADQQWFLTAVRTLLETNGFSRDQISELMMPRLYATFLGEPVEVCIELG